MGFLRNVTAAAVLAATVGGVAQAQVGVTGNTKGCFGSSACTPTHNSDNGLAGVSFAGKNFSWNALTTPQTVNLGKLDFGAFSCAGYVGLCGFAPQTGDFTLESTFTAPATSPSAGFFDSFINAGFVFGEGGASVDFNNTPQTFAFDGGILSLSVNDFTVDPEFLHNTSGKYDVTGTLYYTASSTPEPGSIALLGTGLIGLVPMVRRRRK
jgi:hypothetical protein